MTILEERLYQTIMRELRKQSDTQESINNYLADIAKLLAVLVGRDKEGKNENIA